jgi:hypothetical protein
MANPLPSMSTALLPRHNSYGAKQADVSKGNKANHSSRNNGIPKTKYVELRKPIPTRAPVHLLIARAEDEFNTAYKYAEYIMNTFKDDVSDINDMLHWLNVRDNIKKQLNLLNSYVANHDVHDKNSLYDISRFYKNAKNGFSFSNDIEVLLAKCPKGTWKQRLKSFFE